jgi:hypothetical protein
MSMRPGQAKGPSIGINGGSSVYTGASPSTVTVGGLIAGTVLTGLTDQEILEDILVPYLPPSFSSFAMSQTNPVEVGTTVSGSKSFTFGLNQVANVAANSLSITDVTAAAVILSGAAITSPQSAPIGSIQKNSPGSNQWKGTIVDTHAVSHNSTVYTLSWLYREFYGTSANATLTGANIIALANSPLASNYAGTFAFVASNYKYFAFPDSFGSPTATTGFKDTSTGLAVSMADVGDDAAYSNVQNGWYYAIVSVTSNGVTSNYRVYRTKNILGSSINIQVS